MKAPDILDTIKHYPSWNDKIIPMREHNFEAQFYSKLLTDEECALLKLSIKNINIQNNDISINFYNHCIVETNLLVSKILHKIKDKVNIKIHYFQDEKGNALDIDYLDDEYIMTNIETDFDYSSSIPQVIKVHFSKL